nr:GNAT family N-acetyltransferase [Clostridium acetobutylicum]
MAIQYKTYGEREYFEMYKKSLEDFEGYLIEIENQDKGINLKEGFVPCATYWMVNSDENILGVIRIRKKLSTEILKKVLGNIGYDIAPLERNKGYGKHILKLGLKKAKELNVNPVLVTCDFKNIPSKKIIEYNGGVFDNEVFDEWKNSMVRRYWFYNE